MLLVSESEFRRIIEMWDGTHSFSPTSDLEYTDYFLGDTPIASEQALPNGQMIYRIRKDFD